MPDTYTSQFSGEEIDAALRAAQMISGASTPAELRKKLEIRGDTIPVSAEDSTLISGAVKYRTNPNLLDNWYFGRPVNQRDGYIPKDIFVKVYNDVTCTDYAGPVNYYPSLIKESNGNFKYNIGSNFYYIKAEDTVSGYANVGYTVDRWKQGFDGTLTSTLTDDGIKIVAGNDGTYKNFEQILSYVPTNTTFTMSFLVDNFASINQIYTGFSTAQFDIRDNLITWTFKTGDSISGVKTIGIQTKAGKTVTIKAAKLELGSAQTLAHKENGVWVLNEIPDFGEQLRRCQRFFQRYEINVNAFIPAVMFGGELMYAHFFIPFLTKMRIVPTATFQNNGRFVTATGSVIFNNTTPQLDTRGSTEDFAAMTVHFDALSAGTSGWVDSFGHIDFSADL